MSRQLVLNSEAGKNPVEGLEEECDAICIKEKISEMCEMEVGDLR